MRASQDEKGRMSLDADGASLSRRRSSALEEAPTLVPPMGVMGMLPLRRRSTASRHSVRFTDDNNNAAHNNRHSQAIIDDDDLDALARSASAISGAGGRQQQRRESQDNVFELPMIQRPRAAKPGMPSTIRELPSNLPTPSSTRPPSPSTPGEHYGDYFRVHANRSSAANTRPSSPTRTPTSETSTTAEYEVGLPRHDAYPEIGVIASWRGALLLLATCGAQLMDNVFMTSVNIALPAIQAEFGVGNADLQWLISAYTLTFGGFLLLAGVLSDRYGRKMVFCVGMALLSLWTLAVGFAPNFIALAIFRALQGMGAALTVPSAVGLISNYFVAKDRTLALTIFASSGAVGFCLGLVFGGFLTSSLGWRYVFYVSVAVTGTLGALGWFTLPKDRMEGLARPKLDFVGAGLSTSGLILLSFVLSSGGEYGWAKPFIIVLLILSVALIVFFTWVEKKVPNPIMPLSIWKLRNFAALWVGGFVCYGGYQTAIYYTILICQEVSKLTPGETAIRFLPMGAVGFIFSLGMSRALECFNPKWMLAAGMVLSSVAPLPLAVSHADDLDFWSHVLPTTVMTVAGVTILYCTITVILLDSVPVNVKSLCGGMVNTAFQIGSGVGLALSSAVVQAVDVNKGHSALRQYQTGLWCVVGLSGFGLVATLLGVKNTGKHVGGRVVVAH